MPPDWEHQTPWGSAPALSAFPQTPATRSAPEAQRRPPSGSISAAERYAAGGTLGAGGMGVVAVSRDGLLQREVARKSVRPDLTTAERRERLLREARIAARLEHPAIVPVYDAGLGEDGEPWYAMRLIRGQTLQAAVEARPKLADRLGLMRHFLAACEGMAYAHGLGVLHRDLKPDNILVGELGETQIADWGLARANDAPDETDAEWADEAGDWTQAGALLGTPQYASPEAVRGETVGSASDVWSLGAVLWTLLAGQRPWTDLPVAEVLARTRTATPLPAVPDAPQELLAIVQRAMAPLPADRYPTARELAEEVARWLEGRRVLAHTYSGRELLQRAVRAWRWQLLAAALAGLAIAVAVGVATLRVVAERNRALAAETAAEDALAASRRSEATLLVGEARVAAAAARWPLVDLLARAALGKADSPAARGMIAAAAGWIAPTLRTRNALPACPRWLLPADNVLLCVTDSVTERWQPGAKVPQWRVALPAALAAVRPGASAVELVSARGELWSVDLHSGTQRSALALKTSLRQLVATDAHWLAGGGGVGLFRWDARSGTAISERESLAQEGAVPRQIRAVASDPALGLLVLVVDGELFVYGQGTERPTIVPLDPQLPWSSVVTAALAGDGTQLALGTTTGVLYVVGLDGVLRQQAVVGSSMVRGLQWQGNLIAVGDDEPYVQVFASQPLVRVVAWPLASQGAFRLTAAGELELAAEQHAVWAWQGPAGGPVRDVGQGAGLSGLWAGHNQLLVPDADGRLTRLDLHSGATLERLVLPQAVVKSAVLADGGRLLAVTDPAGWGALLYRVGSAAPPLRLGTARLRRLAVLRGAEGKDVLLQASMGGSLAATRLPEATTVTVEPPLDGEWADLAMGSGDEAAVAIEAHSGKLVRLVAGRDGVSLQTELVGVRPGLAVAAMHPANTTIAAADGARWAVWTDAGQPPGPDVAAASRILDLQWSPDGKWLAAAELDGRIEVWRWPEATLALQLTGHTQRASGLAWTPDSAVLWSASWDGTVRRWGLANALLAQPASLTEREALWGGSWAQWLAPGQADRPAAPTASW